MKRRRVLFIFVDGIGLGSKETAVNPLMAFKGEILNLLSDQKPMLPADGICIPTNVRLETEGRPQSATGQTTLFTGINAAAAIGRHLQGFPTARLKEIIARESLFKKLKDTGKSPTFANTYTPKFFDKRPRWISVTTTMCESAGIRLRQMEDLKNDRGLFMDYTNHYFKATDLEVPERSPAEAAKVLINLTQDHDLVLYEYFLTDYVGHRGNFEEAVSLLESLDHFLSYLVNGVDLDSTSVLISSDHGNVEDFTTRLHTLNPVPTCVWGDLRKNFPDSMLKLTEITPRLVDFFTS